jgi:hypothetical protein
LSTLAEKLEPPAPSAAGNARAYLAQLTHEWALIEVVATDGDGPLELLRHSMQCTRWKRVGRDKKGLLFECMGKES